MSTILETAEVRAMIPTTDGPEKWFSFYSPDEAVEIRCTERESEDFERDTSLRLEADVIDDQATFDRLKAYLTEECGLCDAALAMRQRIESEREAEELRTELEAICRDVAGLDDAGLPVQHKSAIQRARKALALLRRLRP